MKTSPAKTDRHEAGYTLLEVLVVVAIGSLLVAALPSIYARLVPNLQFVQYANDIVVATQQVQLQARAEGKSLDIVVHEDTNLVVFPHRQVEAPGSVEIEFEHTTPFSSDGSVTSIRIYPNGMSSGGRLRLRRQGVERLVNFDWITGLAQVEES